MTTAERVAPDPEVVERHNRLFDLYDSWPGGDPDDDPEFISQAREIMGLAPLTEPVEAAAGRDITPGHDELHHWWVYGPGKKRWKTWTELYTQLAKIPAIGPIKAKPFASRWFFERYRFYSGSDLNRVKHGKPPRGQRVGPG